jgi:hypothetical protein
VTKPVTRKANITQTQANAAVHRSRPKLVKLKVPKGDGPMADTLLFLLERVRRGRVKAFSICLIVHGKDGEETSIESATADGDDRAELQLLGIMRVAEHGLWMRRQARKDAES